MAINTGHVTFDRQTNVIGTGNITANTQFGKCVRAYNTPANPIGQPCKPGEMMDFDLHGFNLPSHVRKAIEAAGKNRNLCLYEFFNDRDGHKVVHGHVLTLDFDHLHELVATFASGPSSSANVVSVASEYVSNPKGSIERVNKVGADMIERLGSGFDARADAATRLALDDVLVLLTQNDDTISDGVRILRNIGSPDIRVAARTEDGILAALAVTTLVNGLSANTQALLAKAVKTIEKSLLADLKDLGGGYDVLKPALHAMLTAKAEKLAVAHSPA
jgi:hypothetical protein